MIIEVAAGFICFNGAALRRERRRDWAGESIEEERERLQWGRSPKRAETCCKAPRNASQAKASMGPLSEESGDCGTHGFLWYPQHWLQWGRSPKRAETGAQNPLTERAERMLQWGRSPKRAEAVQEKSSSEGDPLASMGPLSEESGDPSCYAGTQSVWHASMGPLSEESGDLGGGLYVTHNGWLQWGRSPKRAETKNGA